MRQGLKAIIDKVGVTSILVTHDQEEAFELADQVIIFNRWHLSLHRSLQAVAILLSACMRLVLAVSMCRYWAGCAMVRKGYQQGCT